MPELLQANEQGLFEIDAAFIPNEFKPCIIVNQTGETLLLDQDNFSTLTSIEVILATDNTKKLDLKRNKVLKIGGKSWMDLVLQNKTGLIQNATIKLPTSHMGATEKGTGVFFAELVSEHGFNRDGEASVDIVGDTTEKKYILVNRSGVTLKSYNLLTQGVSTDSLTGDEQSTYEVGDGIEMLGGQALLLTTEAGLGTVTVDFKSLHGGPVPVSSTRNPDNRIAQELILFEV